MSLACKVSGHKWHKTPDGSDGCTCARCGEHNHGGKHDWHKEPGSCLVKCSWCGSEEIHHEWDRCTCTWCGTVQDFDHKWEHIFGTCDFACAICGKVNEGKKSHKWEGCTCTRCGEHRNEGHDFVPTADGGKIVCSICGIGIDESRAQAAIEALEKKERNDYWSYAYDLIGQMEDPACVVSVAPFMPARAFERLGQLGADEELANIARSNGYGYEARREAKRNIRDAALRDSIDVRMTEEEQRWYDYDIKSGM